MNRGRILCAIALAASMMAVNAADTITVVEHITAIEGNSVDQPSRLTELLKPSAAPEAEVSPDREKDKEKAPVVGGKAVGYRVQVYSDGNQRTAKGETQRKAAAVSRRFPNMRTYSSYSAPYWRLRVGDFRTRKEAEDAAASLRSAFPAYRNEIRVVRDRINVKD